MTQRVGIALGSNLGDRFSLMKQARDAVLSLMSSQEPFLQSLLYETAPVDCPDGSGPYLNAVVEGSWKGTAEELLVRCQSIERSLGRVSRRVRNEPRPIDIDILYMGNLELQMPQLVLPHPRCHIRKFVLYPLADICPTRVLPGQRLSVAQLLQTLANSSEGDPIIIANAAWDSSFP